jgi:hypothetical protein
MPALCGLSQLIGSNAVLPSYKTFLNKPLTFWLCSTGALVSEKLWGDVETCRRRENSGNRLLPRFETVPYPRLRDDVTNGPVFKFQLLSQVSHKDPQVIWPGSGSIAPHGS